MIIMQFTFQIILLAVGFGVGYWLLLTTSGQEPTIKTIGQTLGGILIIMAMIFAIFSGYYSMKIANKIYMHGGCPVQRMIQEQEKPAMDNGSVENPDIEKNEDHDREDTSDNEERSIKSNIKDHE